MESEDRNRILNPGHWEGAREGGTEVHRLLLVALGRSGGKAYRARSRIRARESLQTWRGACSETGVNTARHGAGSYPGVRCPGQACVTHSCWDLSTRESWPLLTRPTPGIQQLSPHVLLSSELSPSQDAQAPPLACPVSVLSGGLWPAHLCPAVELSYPSHGLSRPAATLLEQGITIRVRRFAMVPD